MLSRGLSVLVRLLVVAFCASILDGLLNRDPHIRLSHGYEIWATSWSSPCFLVYQPWEDRRPYSAWKAHRRVVQDGSGERSEYSLILDDGTTFESLDFPSESEWKAAIRQKRAKQATSHVKEATGITEFGNYGPFVFGDCEKGFFLLDIDKNEYSISPRQEWVQQVTAKTGSPPGRMKNPKAWLLQDRNRLYYEVMGGFIAVALPLALAPLWRSRPKRGG
jgi:hypothetical protein